MGGLVTLLLTIVTNGMMASNGVIQSESGMPLDTRALLIVTAYRALFACAGCHLASRLAPAGNPRIRYALALGTVLLALNVAGAVTSRGQVPLWYSLVAIALTIPCAIVGGATAVRAIARGRDCPN
jgi:hypothetical protein